MAISIAEFGAERLKRVLEQDKKENPNNIKEILKSDIKRVLKDFVELEDNEINLEINEKEEGFSIIINAEAKRVKPFGIHI